MQGRSLIGLFLASLLASGCADGEAPIVVGDSGQADAQGPDPGWNDDAGDAGKEEEFWTIAVLPDTQNSYYSAPSFFEAETRWIAENYAIERIAFVLHEGDIVDTPSDANQWAVARASMGLLDGKIPYVLAAGNHDFGSAADEPRSTRLNEYFSYDEASSAPTFGGAFATGHLEDAYYLLPGGGRTWLVLSLEFSPRPEVIEWANGILYANASLPAVIVTHAYLYSDNTRYDHVGRACLFSGDCAHQQCWNPVCYLPDGSDGEMLWNTLVSLHSNVHFVFSGHVANPAPLDTGRLTSPRPNGTVCHQIMVDYQSDGATGGDGYFRLVRIWPDGTVRVRTFSPYVEPDNALLTDDRNQFTLQIQIPGG